MGGISIPLPLSPAIKLLMDHAQLTVSYSSDPEMGLWSSAQALQGQLGIFSCLRKNMKFCSVPDCRGCVGAFKSLHRILKICPVPLADAAHSLTVFTQEHSALAMAVKFLSRHQPCFSVLLSDL